MSVDVKSEKSKDSFWETVKVVLTALVLAFLVRVFLYQPFNIPSGSMKPTLLVGDFLFVSKFSYGYSRYSFPYAPDLFSGRIFSSPPKRGDVVVFKLPSDNESDYIKRVIGLPGDRIQMLDGVLNINGKPVKLRRTKDFILHEADGETRRVEQYIETLPNGVSHPVLNLFNNGPGDNTQVYTVPPGHYFMMGDNRDNSADSRFFGPRGVGFVPAQNLIGRAEILFFSIDEEASLWKFWLWPMEIRWPRFFTLIR